MCNCNCSCNNMSESEIKDLIKEEILNNLSLELEVGLDIVDVESFNVNKLLKVTLNYKYLEICSEEISLNSLL